MHINRIMTGENLSLDIKQTEIHEIVFCISIESHNYIIPNRITV